VSQQAILQRPKNRSIRSILLALAASAAVLVVAALGTAPAAAAPPVTAASCGYATAGTGTFASTICWFDMSGYNAVQAQTGQAFAVAIPGGYTLSFTITNSGGAVHAATLPTFGGAYLGSAGHYSGIPGSPALYQSTSHTVTTSVLTNISLTNSSGVAQTGFALVGADAESSDNSESLSWTSSSPITSLTATSSGTGLGNACGGGFTGVGTTTVTCTGASVGTKTGAAILASKAPTTFSQSMTGGGLQAFSFGVLLSSVQLNKTVVGGYAGDAFAVSITDAGGNPVASANTGGTASATTGRTTVVVGSTGSTYTFGETATSGSLANYTQSWSCTRNGATDATLPSGSAGTSTGVTVGVGDTVICTITNTGLTRGLTLTKHAGTPVDVNGDGLTDAGDQIPYTFTVTNSGQVALQNIVVSDAKIGAVTCPQSSLAVGASETCTAASAYTVTAADVSAGSVVNTATASGNAPNSTETITSTPSSTTTPAVAPAPALTVVKSASPSAAASYTAGQVITYSFVVTNSGNVPMNNVTLNEGAFSGTGAMSAPSCPVTFLAVGDQEVCAATYTLTQPDVDAGSITNSATATGTPTGSTTPVTSPPSSVTVPTPPQPAIALVKSATPSAPTVAGQTIAYSFLVTNTGNVDLTGITVNEGAFSGSGTLSAVSCPRSTLVPGQAETCAASYTLTQADVDAGTVSNTATVTGTAPDNTPITSAVSDADLTIDPSAELTLVKTADRTNLTGAGQVIHYSFSVTNTGNVTISTVSVTEGSFNGHGTMSPVTCPGASASLAPGDSVECTADYTVVAADLANGQLVNTATASGTVGGVAVVSDPSTALVSPPVSPSSGQVLAATGVEIGWPGLLATLLVLVGGVLLSVRRRIAGGGAESA